jgi:riboflavin kinase/FMN adenylyltransferase
MLKHSTILKKDSVDTLAIGSFDGIHVGHRQLLKHLGDNGALFVIDKDQANLTPGIKRSEYAGYPCMLLHFLKVKHLSGEEFVALLKREFTHLKKLVVGYDFFFGQHRSCNAHDLKRLFDGEVVIVEEFSYQGISVHSSLIRTYLKEGQLDDANRFLGREYSIIGDVIKGQGIGKSKLVPTLNLRVHEHLIPASGVYATRTKIGTMIYDSVSFVGIRHSTDGHFSVETHILDQDVGAVDGTIQLYFVRFLRENKHFDSLDALKAQINIDMQEARNSLGTCRFYLRDFL